MGNFRPIVIERALYASGARGDLAEAARAAAMELREAGAPISRNSEARWTADQRDPIVREWLAGLATAQHERRERAARG